MLFSPTRNRVCSHSLMKIALPETVNACMLDDLTPYKRNMFFIWILIAKLRPQNHQFSLVQSGLLIDISHTGLYSVDYRQQLCFPPGGGGREITNNITC
jgi:hypothetical protein